ncbi:MAG: hypothetical protein ABIO19_00415 [Burkholderiaceae bacterium]
MVIDAGWPVLASEGSKTGKLPALPVAESCLEYLDGHQCCIPFPAFTIAPVIWPVFFPVPVRII